MADMNTLLGEGIATTRETILMVGRPHLGDNIGLQLRQILVNQALLLEAERRRREKGATDDQA